MATQDIPQTPVSDEIVSKEQQGENEEITNEEEQMNIDAQAIQLRVITPDGDEITLEGISVS